MELLFSLSGVSLGGTTIAPPAFGQTLVAVDERLLFFTDGSTMGTVMDVKTRALTGYPNVVAWLPVPDRGLFVAATKTSFDVYDEATFELVRRVALDGRGQVKLFGLLPRDRIVYSGYLTSLAILDYVLGPQRPSADVGISMTPPSMFRPELDLPVEITVTNRSDVTASSVSVLLSGLGDVKLVAPNWLTSVLGPDPPSLNFFLGDIPPHETSILTLQTRMRTNSACLVAQASTAVTDPDLGNNSVTNCYRTEVDSESAFVDVSLAAALMLNVTGPTVEIPVTLLNRNAIAVTNHSILAAGFDQCKNARHG